MHRACDLNARPFQTDGQTDERFLLTNALRAEDEDEIAYFTVR